MPWRTLCGFPPTQGDVTLLIPNGNWRDDTVITDEDGNEYFVLMYHVNKMKSYAAVFADLDGNPLVCVKRHVLKAFWKDGYYFCTYFKNYPGQRALLDKDPDGKKIYPFSYLEVLPMKGIFYYRHFDDHEQLKAPRMMAQNPWLGFMTVCCTPLMRTGNFTCKFTKGARGSKKAVIEIDQWKNTVTAGPGNDLLAALCMAYVFDKHQCQPLVTVFGREEDEELEDADDASWDEEQLHYNEESRGLNSSNNSNNNEPPVPREITQDTSKVLDDEFALVPYKEAPTPAPYQEPSLMNEPFQEPPGGDQPDLLDDPQLPESEGKEGRQQATGQSLSDPYGKPLVPQEIV